MNMPTPCLPVSVQIGVSVVVIVAKPCGGQADMNRLTARDGSGDQPAHGAGVTRPPAASQRGPATGTGIRHYHHNGARVSAGE